MLTQIALGRLLRMLGQKLEEYVLRVTITSHPQALLSYYSTMVKCYTMMVMVRKRVEKVVWTKQQGMWPVALQNLPTLLVCHAFVFLHLSSHICLPAFVCTHTFVFLHLSTPICPSLHSSLPQEVSTTTQIIHMWCRIFHIAICLIHASSIFPSTSWSHLSVQKLCVSRIRCSNLQYKWRTWYFCICRNGGVWGRIHRLGWEAQVVLCL